MIKMEEIKNKLQQYKQQEENKIFVYYVSNISTKEIVFFKSTEGMNLYIKNNPHSVQISEKEGKYLWLEEQYFLTHGGII